MEEYIYSDVTAEDEAVLAAEEMADQEEGLAGLDDDLGAAAVSDVENEPAEESAESDADDTESVEADEAETPAEDDEQGRSDCAEDAETAGAEDEAADDETTENEDETAEDAAAGDGGKKSPQMVMVVGVRFRTAGKAYYFSPGSYRLYHGMHVIVETARGVEYGTVVTMPMELDRRKVKSPLKEILRPATPEDDATHQDNRRKEREAYRVCYKKIREHRLDMKLIDAEYTFDHSKILFYFTADGRIDFRDLVKDLAGVFKTRIELRQIGVRDETKILGGYGSCGRPLCCHTYLSDFVPVSIKMAKEQNLSLNPTKISGVCGRLMCCLKNEQETYEELNKNLPRQGDEVEGPDGLQGEVESVNVLRQKVRILVEVDDEKELHEYNADEVTMIRRRKRGEAKHRSKRIENGQEGADELRKTTRKGARPDRPVRQADGERTGQTEETDRPARESGRDNAERQGRENDRQTRNNDGERQNRENHRDNNGRGGDGERGQNQNEGQERSGRRSDGRRGVRGSREDRQNAAREHSNRENGGERQERGNREGRDGQSGRGGRGGRNRGDRNEQRGDRNNRGVENASGQERTEGSNVENTGRGAENGGRANENGGQERQNGGRSRHRRGGRGRGERPAGQGQTGGQSQAGGQNQTGGSHES